MTITLDNAAAINKVLSTFTEYKLPIKVSYKLMKILSELEPELQFYQSQLQDLITECAQKDENGEIVYTDESRENIQLISDKTEEFYNRYNELLGMDIEINDFSFTLEELESLELTPKQLFILNDYITE